MDKLRNYYLALKPERTYANVMTTAAGFLFASRWHMDWWLFIATLIGMTLVVMSACGANNWTDRSIDAQMPRTKKRATVSGEVSARNLVILTTLLGAAGFVILGRWVNGLVVLLGAIGYIDYVVLYGWTKRTTIYSTLVGTISGAVPLVAGYAAVTGVFDFTALQLGLIMVFWQMVHFYAIGIFRHDDYAAGGLPIWPVKKGIKNTQQWMIAYASLYELAVILLALNGAGWIFGIVVGGSAVYWLARGLQGFAAEKPAKWARGMFGLSFMTLLVLCAMLAAHVLYT
jgi:protoheme IX farnesyltransferase